MNFQREKTSNALEWQHVMALRTEATTGIQGGHVGLDGGCVKVSVSIQFLFHSTLYSICPFFFFHFNMIIYLILLWNLIHFSS